MKDTIRKWLTEQFGEDEALFKELYDQYAADMKALSAELEALLASGNLTDIGEKAHAMKGMALQIGDSEVSEPCKELQDAGRSGNMDNCQRLIPIVRTAIAAL